MSIQNSRQIETVKVMLNKGIDGAGIESIERTNTVGLVDTYTITLTDGRKYTFTVTNGSSQNAQIADVVTSPALTDYAVGDYVIFDNTLCEVTTAISQGDTYEIGVNLSATTVTDEIKDLDSDITSLASVVAGKQNTLTFDNVPTQNSNNPVKSSGIYTALSLKQNALTFDNVPTDGSDNPVKSNGVYDAINTVDTALQSFLSELNANLTSEGLSVWDNKVTIVKGGYKQIGNLVLVQLHLQANATMTSNTPSLQGFPLFNYYYPNYVALSAYILDTPNKAMIATIDATGMMSFSGCNANDVFVVTGMYTI